MEAHNGGGKEIRTPDFQLAKLALYQLSYTPICCVAHTGLCCSHWACSKMVGLSGLEPLTSRLSGVCSNHLSYKPAPSSGRHFAPVPSVCACQRQPPCGGVGACGFGHCRPGHKRPLATQQQRRREGLSLFIWIVAFADGLETSRSVLIYHPE